MKLNRFWTIVILCLVSASEAVEAVEYPFSQFNTDRGNFIVLKVGNENFKISTLFKAVLNSDSLAFRRSSKEISDLLDDLKSDKSLVATISFNTESSIPRKKNEYEVAKQKYGFVTCSSTKDLIIEELHISPTTRFFLIYNEEISIFMGTDFIEDLEFLIGADIYCID